jgi:hypothetical protein
MPLGIPCRLGSDASGVGEAELLRGGRQRKRRLIVKHEEEVSVSAPRSVGPITHRAETKRRGSRGVERGTHPVRQHGIPPWHGTPPDMHPARHGTPPDTVPHPVARLSRAAVKVSAPAAVACRVCNAEERSQLAQVHWRRAAPKPAHANRLPEVDGIRRGADGVMAELSLPARFASHAELSLASAALRPRGPLHGVADGMHRS